MEGLDPGLRGWSPPKNKFSASDLKDGINTHRLREAFNAFLEQDKGKESAH